MVMSRRSASSSGVPNFWVATLSALRDVKLHGSLPYHTCGYARPIGTALCVLFASELHQIDF